MTLDCICLGSEPTVSKREEKAEPTVSKREEKPLSASTELGDCAVTFVEAAACDEFHGE